MTNFLSIGGNSTLLQNGPILGGSDSFWLMVAPSTTFVGSGGLWGKADFFTFPIFVYLFWGALLCGRRAWYWRPPSWQLPLNIFAPISDEYKANLSRATLCICLHICHNNRKQRNHFLYRTVEVEFGHPRNIFRCGSRSMFLTYKYSRPSQNQFFWVSFLSALNGHI